MQYLRSILYSYICMPILTLFVCGMGLPLLLLPRPIFMKFVIKFWIHAGAFLERHILGLDYEIRGAENLPESGPYIVASKHQSTYETYRIHTLFDDPTIVLKKELQSIPLWGWFLKKSGVIAIDRSTPEKAILSVRDGAIKAAEDGRVIVIFPQGTRVKASDTPKDVSYKPGVFRVQEATNLPIIPMAINSGVFWPKGAFLKKPGRVVIEFLPAIEPGLSRPELMAKLEDVLETRSTALAIQAGFSSDHLLDAAGTDTPPDQAA